MPFVRGAERILTLFMLRHSFFSLETVPMCGVQSLVQLWFLCWSLIRVDWYGVMLFGS